ncbi:uncharacterized protein LOC112638042 [Camponotus floridanus]|uniref:uncharacterized protein LOC112638042 n=1 Tax=Camponotus floridanus TaxID=104421 RepID=UPI000DC6B29E|nr:uncharacterized protein LOC112638042 [Camponotus floridanus]
MDISIYERVKTINDCYTYLEYKDNRKEALRKISTLSKELKFEDFHDFSYRFFETATLIKKNLRIFMAACEHVDVITTIVDYFIHFAVTFKLDNESVTIYNMYKEHVIQQFLEAQKITRPNIKMIVLEDSDLYAVIKCLKMKNILFQLDTIWVQESIKQTFAWYLKKYFRYWQIKFYTFRSKELPTLNTTKYICTIHIVSIWSEDIIAAKNLAESLNHDVLFINSYMDFCPGIVLPYKNIYLKSLPEFFNLQVENKQICTDPINPTMHKGIIIDLFYDGIWQKPMENTYWIHDNILLANATRGDIMKCIDSATEGFKIWSNMSSDLRMQLLVKFANMLECNGQFSQTKIILNWIKLPYICGSLIHCFQTERFEVIKTRKPRGIVILKEKDESILYRELTQSLIIGNSVIVICNPDLCILAPYCDMFKMSGIPPGVINLLSSENINFRYNIINNSTVNETYEALTDVKHIIVSRK